VIPRRPRGVLSLTGVGGHHGANRGPVNPKLNTQPPLYQVSGFIKDGSCITQDVMREVTAGLASLCLDAAPPAAHCDGLDHDGWSTVQHRRARTQPWPAAESLAHSGAHFDAARARSLAAGGGPAPEAAQEIFSKVVICGFIRCSRCNSPLTWRICGSGPSLSRRCCCFYY
jgi:hypothetical protein